MDALKLTQTCLLSTAAMLIFLATFAHAYVGPSCRTCLITGDWPACAQCYSSKPSVVPFYGMAKRSGGGPQSSDNYGFLPGSYYDNLRGDSSYNVYKRGLPINNVGFLPGGGLLDEYRGESSKRGLPINNVGFLPGGGLLDDYRGDSSANVYKRGLPINNVGFLPGGGLLDDYRGDSLYSNMYRRSSGGNVPMGEMRKRGDYLATYCCVGLQDDDCCDLIGEPEPENDWEEEEAYELFDEDSCLICLHKDSFDYEYCLQCVKKRK